MRENVNIEFITSDSARAKAVTKLGLNEPSALDLVDRSKYANEDSYLDACVQEKLRRSSPEYKKARRELQAEYAERMEMERQAAQEEEYERIRAAVTLDDLDERNIEEEARQLARADLVAGRVSARGLAEAIEKYAAELTEKRKDTKANNQMFNAMLRGR